MYNWGIPNATLFFGSVLVVLVLLWRLWSTRREATEGDQMLRLFLVLILTALAVITLPSLLAIQKWLTNLVLPLGLLWSGLAVVAIALHRCRLRALAAFVWILWLFLTLAGNEVVSRRLLADLEENYARIDPLAVASRTDPFDLVVALGGSTNATPAGQAELTEAGDRVAVAARVYHAGQAKLLATTGEAKPELQGDGRYPAEEVRRIWRGLGIPRDAILVLPGATTRSEFEALAEVAEDRGWDRIGVVTSAWHMDRALRLAEAAGLRVEPLPANFLGVVPPWRLTSIIPTDQAVFETSRALKEHLARLVGR